MCPVSFANALTDKILVVMGGTSGIGLSAARAFVAAGARVVAVGLDENSVAAARRDLGDAARVFCGDAANPTVAEQALAAALQTWGAVHGLYHVAGGSGRRWGDGPLHEMTDEGWEKTLELNLTSVKNSNRAAVRHFLQEKRGGTILNLGSVLAQAPSPKNFATIAYATAKAGIAGFTKACAAYYAPHDIRFNMIAPGLIATPMSKRAQTDARISEYVRRKQPLAGGGIGNPEDLDGAAIYFMSDLSRLVTGQVLAVDGGWSVTDAGA